MAEVETLGRLVVVLQNYPLVVEEQGKTVEVPSRLAALDDPAPLFSSSAGIFAQQILLHLPTSWY